MLDLVAGIEVEWQFDAVDIRPVVRWLRARAADQAVGGPSTVSTAETPPVTQRDTYLDTPDWRIHRAGYSLRVRRRGATSEATLKALSRPSNDGPRRRREVTEQLSTPDLHGLVGAEGIVGELIRPVIGRSELVPLFDVRTRRRSFDLSVGGVPAGAVVLDETSVPLGDGIAPARLERVEVEVEEPFEEVLSSFVQDLIDACGLGPAALSKYEVGLLSRNLHPAGASEIGPTEVMPSQTVGETAFAVMRIHFRSFAAHEPGTRLGEDPEDLHDMRVATRRLRAVIALFQGALPVRMARVRDELGWVGGALGAVRDLDVALEQLDAWSSEDLAEDRGALETVRELVVGERNRARAALLEVLDSPRYARLVDGTTKLLLAGPLKRSASSRTPVRSAAPALVGRCQRAFLKAGDRIGGDATAEDYHRLRIRTKRLRYAIESLTEVYAGKTGPLIKRLVELQDLLGSQHDAAEAKHRLHQLATADGSGLDPSTVFAMGMAAERYEQQERSIRSRFFKTYQRVHRNAWRRFDQEMKRGVADGVVVPAPSTP